MRICIWWIGMDRRVAAYVRTVTRCTKFNATKTATRNADTETGIRRPGPTPVHRTYAVCTRIVFAIIVIDVERLPHLYLFCYWCEYSVEPEQLRTQFMRYGVWLIRLISSHCNRNQCFPFTPIARTSLIGRIPFSTLNKLILSGFGIVALVARKMLARNRIGTNGPYFLYLHRDFSGDMMRWIDGIILFPVSVMFEVRSNMIVGSSLWVIQMQLVRNDR